MSEKYLKDVFGISVKDLIKILCDFPLDGEVWLSTGFMKSSPLTEVISLNKDDVLLTPSNYTED